MIKLTCDNCGNQVYEQDDFSESEWRCGTCGHINNQAEYDS